MNLKQQDILVILKMISKGSLPYGVMAKELGMSAAEVHAAVKRAAAEGYVTMPSNSRREVNRGYFFDNLKSIVGKVKPGSAVQGIPTAHAAPPLNTQIVMPDGDLPYVWPDADGTVRGFELPPLYKSVPKAVKQDNRLYELLALVDALRIGRARERGLAMKELKKRICPTESVPLSIGPWGINEITIKEWVESFTGSEQILPDLIRRLVLFLVPRDNLLRVHFHAHKANNLPGYDGKLITHSPSIFSNTEHALWELSVNKRVRTKLDRDNDQEKELPWGMNHSTTTYIGLTGRSFSDQKKREWEEEKRKEGTWADVRLYDAVDIAQWLTLAPAVSCWFREVLGSPQDGLFSVEEYFNAWAHRAERLTLTECIVLAGRADEQEALIKRLREKSQRIRVHSDDPDESFVILCAIILSLPEESPERADLLSRTMIVTSRDAWSRLLRQIKGMTGLILVAAFDEYDGNTYGCEGNTVYMQVRDGAEIQLKPICREALARALLEIMSDAEEGEDRARKAAYDCGGRLSSLQRLYGYQSPLPDWASEADPVALPALLLCGAWRPDNPGDRAILEKLSDGRSYADIEGLANKLMNEVRGPPLRMQSDCIKWRSLKDAWWLLIRKITPATLDRFCKVCAEVLGKESPGYNLSPDERLLADTEKKTLPESDELRNGLAESLAMLRVMADKLPAPSTEREVHGRIDSTVRTLLSGGIWKVWASQGARLPDLAEAAPEAFLDALERVLADDPDGMKPLFEQESSEYVLFSEFCQAGLLWALELLAWHKKYFPRVVKALIRLCALDNGKSNTTHRPESALQSLFHPIFKQTAASNVQRLMVLKRMDTSMQKKVVNRVLNICVQGAVTDCNYRPEFASWEIPHALEQYSTQESMLFISEIRNLSIASIKADVDHLIELFENKGIEMIVDDAFRIMGERLDDYHRQGPDTVNGLCGCLRMWLDRQKLIHKKEELPEERIHVARNLLNQMEPEDVVERSAWLFSQRETLSEQDEERRIALQEVLQGKDAFHRLLDLARKASAPYLIGWSLVELEGRDRFEHDLIYEALSQDGKINELARSFCRKMFLEKGAEWALGWADQLIRDHAGLLAADFLAEMDSIPAFREWIGAHSDDIQTRYWGRVSLFNAVFRDPADFSNTLDAVLKVHRWDQALKMARDSLSNTEHTVGKASDYLRILRYPMEEGAGNAMEPGNPLVSLQYVLAKIFLWLDVARGRIQRDELAKLEVFYFDVLKHSGRKPRYIWQQMADNPAFFAHLVLTIFRPATDQRSSDENPEDEKEQHKKYAEVVFKLLNNWNGYPGDDKPAAERDTLLRKWCDEVLERTKQDDREAIGQRRVGEVLARVRPDEADGVWPCRVARDYIEKGCKHIANGVHDGRFNSMGMRSFRTDNAGKQEREWALAYQDAADRIRDEYPETASMLEGLAKEYLFLAEHDTRDMEKYTDP